MSNIYAEVGASFQQVGGDKPEGWITMSEPRPSLDHVAREDGVWVKLFPTYQSELADLNTALQEKINAYNKAFAIAALSDGPTEETKKLAIRANYQATKDQYALDKAVLKIKYGL